MPSFFFSHYLRHALGCLSLMGLALGLFFSNQPPDNLREAIAEFETEFNDVPQLSAKMWGELTETQRQEMVLVDVRTEPEIDVSIIPGAITWDEYQANQSKYEGQAVVTYCTVGYRSAHAARELREQGVTAYNFYGGIIAWTQVHGTLHDLTGAITNRVHTYGSRWDFVSSEYQSTW